MCIRDSKEDAGSEPYVRWSYVREYCLSLIKGKQTPLRFHFILSLSPDQIEALLQRADPVSYTHLKPGAHDG